MNNSIWQRNIPDFPPLKNDIKTDVLIIGGGLCGLLCAYYLKKAGIDTIVCEAEQIASQTTSRSTAVVSVGQPLLISDLSDSHGIEDAKQILHYRLDALEAYKRLASEIGAYNELTDFLLYDTTGTDKLKNEQKMLSSLGVKTQFDTHMPIEFSAASTLRFGEQIMLDPLDFCAKLSSKLQIYEHTRITKLTDSGAIANACSIFANRVIIATHFPFPKLRGLFSLKLYQQRSHVIALSGVKDLGFACEDISPNGFYLRSYTPPDSEPLLLIGGADHRTGTKGGFGALFDFRDKYFPDAKTVGSWSTQDTVSLDELPYIGRLTNHDKRRFVATGFGGYGFFGSMAAAKILTEHISKGADLPRVFDPSRSMLTSQLTKNVGMALKSYVTPSARRCPHLGCALVYNQSERIWDCPCHGSRFDKHGRLENGPAQHDL